VVADDPALLGVGGQAPGELLRPGSLTFLDK
jgi:hypothetical protein